MKRTYKALAFCALATLPAFTAGTVFAAQPTHSKTTAPTEFKAEEAETKTVNLTVTGMRWGVACVGKVRSALTAVAGVSKADVSMPDKAVVTAKSSVTAADLIKAIKAAGFGASVTVEKKKGASL